MPGACTAHTFYPLHGILARCKLERRVDCAEHAINHVCEAAGELGNGAILCWLHAQGGSQDGYSTVLMRAAVGGQLDLFEGALQLMSKNRTARYAIEAHLPEAAIGGNTGILE